MIVYWPLNHTVHVKSACTCANKHTNFSSDFNLIYICNVPLTFTVMTLLLSTADEQRAVNEDGQQVCATVLCSDNSPHKCWCHRQVGHCFHQLSQGLAVRPPPRAGYSGHSCHSGTQSMAAFPLGKSSLRVCWWLQHKDQSFPVKLRVSTHRQIAWIYFYLDKRPLHCKK